MTNRERRRASASSGDAAGATRYYAVSFVALLAFIVLGLGTASDGGSQTEGASVTLLSRLSENIAVPPEWLKATARDVTTLGSEVVLAGLTLGTIGLLIVLGAGPALRFLLMSTLGGAAMAAMLKVAFNRPRPELLSHDDYVFTPSFPSGHATMTAVVFLSLAFIVAAQSRRVVRVYVVSAAVVAMIAVGVSRVVLGVHWPSDVLGGWLLGIAWVVFCARLLLRPETEDSSL